MEIDKSLDDSGLLIECVTQTVENKTKEQSVGFLGILLGKLYASLPGNILAGKGIRQAKGGVTKAGTGGITGLAVKYAELGRVIFSST